VHVLAKDTIKTDDGVSIYIHKEGYGRSSQAEMKAVFGDDPASASMKNGGADWYTKTFPRFRLRMDRMCGWQSLALSAICSRRIDRTM
jgi:hypothetical protein